MTATPVTLQQQNFTHCKFSASSERMDFSIFSVFLVRMKKVKNIFGRKEMKKKNAQKSSQK